MADDWEDWEADDYTPTLPTVGQAALAKASEPDQSKFAGEDEDAEDKPKWEGSVPKPQQKKATARPAYEDRGTVLDDDDQTLDDPVAEKLRKQKLVEDADLRSTQDLFGGEAGSSLDGFTLKSAKDFENFGKLLAQKYISVHTKSPHYKTLLKVVVREALAVADVQMVKDVEVSLAGIRSEKIKADNAKQAAAKVAGKKKNLNAGRGGASAGLDDYQFDQALDDEVDFM